MRRPLPQPKHCLLYRPGHQVHWIQWRHSLDDEKGLRGRIVAQDEQLVRVVLRDGSRRAYRHRDPERLAFLVSYAGPAVWVQERWSLLRVGSGHCLSIARDGDSRLERCVPGAGSDTASDPARVPPSAGLR